LDKKIEFVADNCKVVSLTTSALGFTCEMLLMERSLADIDGDQIVSDDEVAPIADDAPSSDTAQA
jgi:hypothetical protein